MTDKTVELRELAQAAQRIDEAELRRYEHGGGRIMWQKDGQHELIADFYDKTYREFYAALKPSVVLALLERLSQSGVPEGWKLVPVRITDSMMQAGATALDGHGKRISPLDAELVFIAMLAAAPTPVRESEQK